MGLVREGVFGVCDNQRNLGNEEVKGIAHSSGVLGVAYFHPAFCGETELEGILGRSGNHQ
jgi:microsomal dipeptidase-like Zn-dependent dipeptidase